MDREEYLKEKARKDFEEEIKAQLKKEAEAGINPQCKRCRFLNYNEEENVYWCAYDDPQGEHFFSYQVIFEKEDCPAFWNKKEEKYGNDERT